MSSYTISSRNDFAYSAEPLLRYQANSTAWLSHSCGSKCHHGKGKWEKVTTKQWDSSYSAFQLVSFPGAHPANVVSFHLWVVVQLTEMCYNSFEKCYNMYSIYYISCLSNQVLLLLCYRWNVLSDEKQLVWRLGNFVSLSWSETAYYLMLDVVTWHHCCLSLPLKAAFLLSDLFFWTCSPCSYTFLTHLVIISNFTDD